MAQNDQHSSLTNDLAAAEAEVRTLKELMPEKIESLRARKDAIKQLRRELNDATSRSLLTRTKLRPAYRKTKKVGKQVVKSTVAAAWFGVALAGSVALFAKYRPGR